MVSIRMSVSGEFWCSHMADVPYSDLSRLIFYRESASKTYRQFPFALSMVIAEMPYSILCAVGFFLPIYYM